MIQQHATMVYYWGAAPWSVFLQQAEVAAKKSWKAVTNPGRGCRPQIYKPGDATEMAVLAYIQKHGSTGTIAICEALNISNHTVLRHTRNLIANKAIKRTANKTGAFRYSIV